ncbi:hypothetical protein L1987_89705 [Smallanthus sonchifolius]|nr:hypothetical protein L1987_89705 [Smallanthus sonchifolius]
MPTPMLSGKEYQRSFDRTRWPIVFLERVVSKLFDQDFSEAVSFLLSGGEFDVPWVTTPGSTVRISELGGAGYRVLARLDHRRPRRYSRLVVMGLKLLSPSYPLDFWLG